jgi:hypothetical protein
MNVSQLARLLLTDDMPPHALVMAQLPNGVIYDVERVELEDPGEEAVGPTVWLKLTEF